MYLFLTVLFVYKCDLLFTFITVIYLCCMCLFVLCVHFISLSCELSLAEFFHPLFPCLCGLLHFLAADSNCELGEEAWMGRRGRGRKRACPTKEKWVKRREKMLSLHHQPRLEEPGFPEPPKTIGGQQESLLSFFQLYQESNNTQASSSIALLAKK